MGGGVYWTTEPDKAGNYGNAQTLNRKSKLNSLFKIEER
jgi:hypothetical protein